jgi:hypothetical protein
MGEGGINLSSERGIPRVCMMERAFWYCWEASEGVVMRRESSA